jgi:hypothetical protein
LAAVLSAENLPKLEQARMTMAAAIGAFALITLAPRIFGLFPGIVRASLTLRTLVPESPLPGYVVALIEPLYMVFLMLVIVTVAQVGNALVFFGMLSLFVSTIFLMKEVRALSKPMDPVAMNAHLKPLRMRMLIATGIGLLFLLIGSHDAWKEVGTWKLLGVVCHLFGNIFLLTAVTADFFIGLMKYSFDEEKNFRASPLYSDLERRFADLAQVRLTQILDEEPAPAPPVPPPQQA